MPWQGWRNMNSIALSEECKRVKNRQKWSLWQINNAPNEDHWQISTPHHAFTSLETLQTLRGHEREQRWETEGEEESQSQGNFFARGKCEWGNFFFLFGLRTESGKWEPPKEVVGTAKKVGSWRVADRVKSIDPTSPSFRSGPGVHHLP